MSLFQIFLTIFCVIAIATGQILFKKIGVEIEKSGKWLTINVISLTALAFFIYGCTTLLWIYILRSTELSKAYIFMALSFIIVPVASYFIFSERLSHTFLFGTTLIVSGIIVIMKYG